MRVPRFFIGEKTTEPLGRYREALLFSVSIQGCYSWRMKLVISVKEESCSRIHADLRLTLRTVAQTPASRFFVSFMVKEFYREGRQEARRKRGMARIGPIRPIALGYIGACVPSVMNSYVRIERDECVFSKMGGLPGPGRLFQGDSCLLQLPDHVRL